MDELKIVGCGRIEDSKTSLVISFNREPTDAELAWIHIDVQSFLQHAYIDRILINPPDLTASNPFLRDEEALVRH